MLQSHKNVNSKKTDRTTTFYLIIIALYSIKKPVRIVRQVSRVSELRDIPRTLNCRNHVG